jgi:hypothetical protein
MRGGAPSRHPGPPASVVAGQPRADQDPLSPVRERSQEARQRLGRVDAVSAHHDRVVDRPAQGVLEGGLAVAPVAVVADGGVQAQGVRGLSRQRGRAGDPPWSDRGAPRSPPARPRGPGEPGRAYVRAARDREHRTGRGRCAARWREVRTPLAALRARRSRDRPWPRCSPTASTPDAASGKSSGRTCTVERRARPCLSRTRPRSGTRSTRGRGGRTPPVGAPARRPRAGAGPGALPSAPPSPRAAAPT